MTTPKKPGPVTVHIFEMTDIAGGQSWDKPKRTGGRAPKPRSEQQQKLDAKGTALYEEWVLTGRVREMDKSPKTRLLVNPDGAVILKHMLRRIADSTGPLPGKSVRIRETPHPSGRVSVTFAVWDRAPKKQK